MDPPSPQGVYRNPADVGGLLQRCEHRLIHGNKLETLSGTASKHLLGEPILAVLTAKTQLSVSPDIF